MKKQILIIFLSFLLIFTLACSSTSTNNDNGQDDALEELSDTTSSSTENIKLATWNIRILSDGSRDDTELSQIAEIIKRYDLVAIQEARDTAVLNRLKNMLPGYDYIVSNPVGSTVKELYAYFYKTEYISPLGTPYLYVESNDEFIREPFIACFKAGNFDFTLVEIHVIYGDTISERRAEVSLLDDVIQAIKEANTGENDIILVGDFNLESDDSAWQMSAIGYQNLVDPTQKTTITDTSSYDNLWINTTYTQEYESFNEIYRFDEIMFNNDDYAAELAVRDHRPVSAIFRADLPDDDTGTGCGSQNNPPGTQGTPDVRIYSVIASPTESEQITLKNYSSFTADISRWTLGDLNDPTAYTITYNTYLSPEETITFTHTTLGFVINNSGETIFLKDTDGNTIDTWGN